MEVICAYCKKAFKASLLTQKYCCGNCRLEANRKAKKKKPEFIKICDFCGIEYTTTHLRQKYCTERCSHHAYRARVKERTGDEPIDHLLGVDESIREVRELYGLTPIVKAAIKCINCGNEFISEDVNREKTCLNCRNKAEDEPFPDYVGARAKRNGSPYIMPKSSSW